MLQQTVEWCMRGRCAGRCRREIFWEDDVNRSLSNMYVLFLNQSVALFSNQITVFWCSVKLIRLHTTGLISHAFTVLCTHLQSCHCECMWLWACHCECMWLWMLSTPFLILPVFLIWCIAIKAYYIDWVIVSVGWVKHVSSDWTFFESAVHSAQ